MKNIVNSKKTAAEYAAQYAVLTALGLVLSYVEMLLPLNPGIPGAKIGLANLVTMCALYLMGPKQAFSVGILRILLSGLLFGNVFSIVYSASGFLLSFAGMFLLKRFGSFGIAAVSAAGGVMHNMGQLVIAAFLAGSTVFAYFPLLFAYGTAAGIIIGILGGIIVQRLKSVVK